jgi:hypothetical protein
MKTMWTMWCLGLALGIAIGGKLHSYPVVESVVLTLGIIYSLIILIYTIMTRD